MRTLLWLLAIVCLGLWSLLAWGALGLAGASFDSLSLGEQPLAAALTVEKWANMVSWLGQGAVLLIWGAGALAILLAPIILPQVIALPFKVLRASASAVIHGRRRRDGPGPSLAGRLIKRAVRRRTFLLP